MVFWGFNVRVPVLVGFALVLLASCTAPLTGLFVLTDVNASSCFNASASMTPGETAFLNASINVTGAGTCITLDVFNVTLDCQGNTVRATVADTTGVFVVNDSVTVENCVFTNFTGSQGRAVHVENASNATVRNSTFTPAGDARVRLVNASNATVQNSSFVQNASNAAIKVLDTAWFLIEGSTFEDSIEVQKSSDGTIRENMFVDTDDGETTLLNDVIDMMDVSRMMIEDNTGIRSGVVGTLTSDSSVLSNSLSENGRISLSGSGNTVSANTWSSVTVVDGASAGITLLGQGTIANNVLQNGIMLTINVNAQNSTVENNTVKDIVGTGFYVNASVNVTLRNNTVRNLTGVAFDMEGSRNVTFDDNRVFFVNKLTNRRAGLFIVSLPETPEAGFAFRLIDSNDTIVQNNRVNVSNAANLSIETSGVVADGLRGAMVGNNSIDDVRECVFVRESSDVSVVNNTLTDCAHKGVMVDGGSNNVIENNDVTASGTPDVFLFKRSVELFRTASARVDRNRLSGFRTGLYVYNVSWSNLSMNNVSAVSEGVFSFLSANNVFDGIRVTLGKVGLKLFFTNGSVVNNSNFSATRTCELHQSFANNITNSTFAGVDCLVSHMSADNVFNNNTFASTGVADIIFDVFAVNNTGTDNTLPTGTIERNFASDNTVS